MPHHVIGGHRDAHRRFAAAVGKFVVKSCTVIVARMVAMLLVILLVHWVDKFVPLYFIVTAVAAGIMLLALVTPIPGFRFLATLETSDRLAIWIVVVVLGVIGYLHNANVWVADGVVNRPTDVALWKAELILGIALAAPATHWLAGLLLPKIFFMNGKRFATEFALYVNFSGIALVLWTGDAALSVSTLGSVLALMVLAELTLYASG